MTLYELFDMAAYGACSLWMAYEGETEEITIKPNPELAKKYLDLYNELEDIRKLLSGERF